MYFSEWRKFQKNKEMFDISLSFIEEGVSKQNFEKIIHIFLPFVKKELSIKEFPKIHFVEDPKFAKRIAAFGQIKNNRIVIDIQNRQIMDILRTVAHELTHYRQHKKGVYGNDHAGVPTENEANKLAGTIVRKFGEKHSELFTFPSVNGAKKKKKKTTNIDGDNYPEKLI